MQTSAFSVRGPRNPCGVPRPRLRTSVLEEMRDGIHSRHEVEREPGPTVDAVVFRELWEGHLDFYPSLATPGASV